MTDRSVLASILTFSAPGSLVDCVRAVLAQDRPPDAVLVIDNAGSPPAEVALRDAGLLGSGVVRVERQAANGGPAGGHAAGLAAFLTSGHDLCWVMDDDCVPAPDCLAVLLDGAGASGVARFPIRVEEDGSDNGPPTWSGVLLGRDVVERAGLPRADLFWWAEDTEYLRWRIVAAGVRREVVTQARVHHSRVRTPGARRPAWRYYYEARNTVYLPSRTPGRRSGRRIARFLAALVRRVLLRERGRTRKLWYLARGVADGALGRLGPRVAVDDR